MAAFEALTNVRTGRPRQLRRLVPAARRAEAGAMLLTLRDLGYDDEQLLAILSALYHGHAAEGAEGKADGGSSGGGGGGTGGGGAGGGASGGGSSGATGSGGGGGGGGNRLAPIRGAWTALGGGELVRLPVNPFDFKRSMGGERAGPKEVIDLLITC